MLSISAYRPSQIHAQLGDGFFDPVKAADFPDAQLRFRNQGWAERIGLGGLSETDWITHFARFVPLEGNYETPLALRYHGHQFQTYNPDLGDGRGFLFAQMYDDQDRLLDLGTKGSGQTPWSRTADGRLTLKGGVREVLATSMLEALGVNTSKSFSLVETGEALLRGDEPSPTRSSVLVRLSHSHIRIGTFQRLAFLHDEEGLAKLLKHCVEHYLPQARRDNQADTAAALLAEVCRLVAHTGASWTAAGFVHGVLNSDNINVTGESFDYGPWRFLPVYDPDFTAAYFDQTGLYAFGRQPDALAWNLTRLAECLVPIGDVATLEPALNTYWSRFQTALPQAYLRRLGLRPLDPARDTHLTQSLIRFLDETRAPYEQVIFDLRGGTSGSERRRRSPVADIYASASFAPLAETLRGYELADDCRLEHAYFARKQPHTMLIEDVEAIWTPIAERDDWQLFHRALAEIAEMGEANGGALPID